MADYSLLDRTFWDFSQPPLVVSAVSASANADASAADVQVPTVVDAVSASANADASAATVLAGPGICRAAAQSASARYQASPAGVVQQGAEITTLWARVQTTTLLQGIMATSLHGPSGQTTTLVSAGTSTTLLGNPGVMTMLAGMPASTTLYSTPQAI